MSGIKSFWNQSSYELSFTKIENRGNTGTVHPRTNYDTDVWLPWVDTPDQFLTKVLVLEVIRETRFYIWESGQHIYYCEDPSTLEGPFSATSQVTINPQNFSRGQLVLGDSDRNDKIVQVRYVDGKFKLHFLKK